jgi:hypothetical protein
MLGFCALVWKQKQSICGLHELCKDGEKTNVPDNIKGKIPVPMLRDFSGNLSKDIPHRIHVLASMLFF